MITDEERVGRFETVAGNVLKYAALISIIATIFALGVNWFLFLGWGVSYAAAVSTSDVIIGGIEALGIFFPHLFLGTLSFFGARQIRARYPWSQKFAPLLLGLSIVTISCIKPSGIEFPDYVLDLVSFTGRSYLDYLIVWPFLIASVGLMSWEKFDFLLASGLFAGVMVVLLISLIDGFQNRTTNLQIWGPDKRCKSAEYVVWVGSDKLVTSCSQPPYTEENSYFIIPKQGVEMRFIGKTVSINHAQTH
ncbi:hypothetical protein A6F68_02134 [Tsuneonella dongtanensis]|uniref:Uncharacterized protein n=1 Tax=Tsuneonella dongtanensis TaxID=692370 RepID=A0A1B2AES6_9SPHN|nr:hypothetical protein [Tsuneonella dongtanensis]ANY20636.1 hypothetical protein A6F68_02134 [Tsuneonella dongtanensis]